MIAAYDALINQFVEKQIGVTQHFLNADLLSHLRENLITLYEQGDLYKAGIGNASNVQQNNLIRRDSIYWLDRKHNNLHENRFFDCMDAFIEHLNRTCYTGITGYEFHYTLYQAGDFYTKHLDQFKENSTRKYSMIMYLNTNWDPRDGGELCVHHKEEQQKIAPCNGTTVFFSSKELLHEVLVTNCNRMSITGWLKVES